MGCYLPLLDWEMPFHASCVPMVPLENHRERRGCMLLYDGLKDKGH